jgi:hypothetical protein
MSTPCCLNFCVDAAKTSFSGGVCRYNWYESRLCGVLSYLFPSDGDGKLSGCVGGYQLWH